jgi:tRNA pseudouridine55 synthase
MDGALILDKPAGMTSHDVVLAARRILGEKRIGHLGTLDPFATGVLVLVVGQATRLARYYGSRDKTYQGIIRFGFSTDTMDGTGRRIGEDRAPVLNKDETRLAFSQFLGPSLQRPPVFSAKKVGGVPAYRLARKGRVAELEPVAVTVHAFDLLWAESSRAGFTAKVSSGTYIRSLVHDLGERIGFGAHLEELRRTAVGEFGENDALTLKEFEEQRLRGASPLISLSQLLPEMPAITLDAGAAAMVVNGRDLELDTIADRVRLLGPEGSLIAVGERVFGSWFHPVVVLDSAGKALAAVPLEGSASSRAAGSL